MPPNKEPVEITLTVDEHRDSEFEVTSGILSDTGVFPGIRDLSSSEIERAVFIKSHAKFISGDVLAVFRPDDARPRIALGRTDELGTATLHYTGLLRVFKSNRPRGRV